jgi:MFS family permease
VAGKRIRVIVAIAIPTLQKELDLSSTGVQWIINGYLLSLSALFAFGGRLADIAGHRRMVVIGGVVFATASALCGAKGIAKAQADQVAGCVSSGSAATCEGLAHQAGNQAKLLFSSVPHDFALASRTVFYGVAAVMAVAFVVSLIAMPGSKVEEQVEDPASGPLAEAG